MLELKEYWPAYLAFVSLGIIAATVLYYRIKREGGWENKELKQLRQDMNTRFDAMTKAIETNTNSINSLISEIQLDRKSKDDK